MSKAIQFRNKNNEKIYPCPYYPVGSVYLSVNSTDPGTIFGGKWERIKGGFLYGCVNSSGSGNGTGTSTGAASGNTGSTALSISQIPSHTHETVGGRNLGSLRLKTDTFADGKWKAPISSNDSDYGFHDYGKLENTGGGQGHTHSLNSHTHVVPYIAVYAWKRVS